MTAPIDRDLWLQERRSGIGASECAAVLGLNPYRGALDVYNAKIGIGPEIAETEAMAWGRRLEPLIAESFAARHPEYTLLTPPEFTIVRHSDMPFLLCTPDRWLCNSDGEQSGLQIKSAGLRQIALWGDNPPEHYLVQCLHEMICHGAPYWWLGALIGGQTEKEYRIERDADLSAEIIRRLIAFWEGHVLAHVPPPMDATPAADRLLKHLYPQSTEFIRAAEPGELDMLTQYADSRRLRINAERKEDTLANIIKDRIGTSAGIEWNGGRILWKSTKGQRVTDFKAVAAELDPPQEVLDRHTSVRPGTRRLTVNLKGDSDGDDE